MERELLALRPTELEQAKTQPPVSLAPADDALPGEWAELSPLPNFPLVPRCPHVVWHPLQAAGWFLKNGVGILALIALFAVLAAIPIANVLALGYLLEVQGRVARTGKLRDAFPMLELAPRLGAMVLGIGFWLLPLTFLAGYASDARLIDPGSPAALGWGRARGALVVFVTIHLCLALARGGRLSCFFRPLKNLIWLIDTLRSPEADYWFTAEKNVRDFVARWRLGHLFSLGLRGLAGAFLWLAWPTLLFAAANKPEGGAVLITLLGGVMLMLVLSWLPFLQARFAAENRFGEFFNWSAIRESFRRAPLAYLIALLGVYVLSLPLYLSKIALPPRDAVVLLTPLFIVSIYPAKVLSGWAYHRARHKPERAWSGWCWLARLLMIPLLGLYVFLLFFTQFIGAQGKWVLFQHHAFLLPSPF